MKIIIYLIVTILNCNIAMADESTLPAPATNINTSEIASSKSYFKLIVGRNNLPPIKSFNNSKQNMSNNIYGGVGVGFDVDDSLRMDLLFEYSTTNFYLNSKFQELNVIYPNLRNTLINNISFNIYKDLYNFTDNMTFFVGGGIGCSEIIEKIKYVTFSLDSKDSTKIKRYEGRLANKSRFKLSYNLAAGLNYSISSSAKLELMYNYKNYEKTKNKIRGIGEDLNVKYGCHIVTIGVRKNF